MGTGRWVRPSLGIDEGASFGSAVLDTVEEPCRGLAAGRCRWGGRNDREPHYDPAALTAQVAALLEPFSARSGLAVDWPLGHRDDSAEPRPGS